MKAAIDIGTNTVLLLIGSMHNGTLDVHHEEQRVPRLGKGVDKGKKLTNKAMQRVLTALQEYRQKIKTGYPEVESVRVTATSAVRDATNKKSFLERVAKKTGWEVEVLSGFEEARLTYLGAQSVIDNRNDQNVIIDIGGGSTEVASGGNQNLRDRYSYDMGCVRFTERFLKDDVPQKVHIKNCRVAIRGTLSEYEFNFVDEASLIGVAGTVTSLAYIMRGLTTYDTSLLDGYEITLKTLSESIQTISNYTSQELLSRYPKVMEGRADIFLAGLLILQEFMKKYNFEKLIASTGGIRHGAILDDPTHKS